MNFKKTLFILGLVLALGAGVTGFYLYKLQTQPVPVFRVKPSLGIAITPGTLITSNMVEPGVILKRDLTSELISGQQLGKVYASKYLYPNDILVSSKVTTSTPHFLAPGERIVSVKPADPGLLGMLNPDDRITVIAGTVTIPNIEVVGVLDSNGNILSILPQFGREQAGGSSLLSLGATSGNGSGKGPDRVLVLITQEKADIIAKSPAQQITVLFEGRNTLGTSAPTVSAQPVKGGS